MCGWEVKVQLPAPASLGGAPGRWADLSVFPVGLLLGGLPLEQAEKRQLGARGAWRWLEAKGGGWWRKERGLPVDEQEVCHEAQHGGDGGGDGQVALKVVLQAQK